MSLRTTLALIVAALVVGALVYVNPFERGDKKQEEPPWFYQVSMDDINVIEVNHQGKQVRFVRNEEDAWVFVDPAGIPPSHQRWGGMTLLLSGPQTRRLLRDTIDDPAKYGLDNPQTIIDFDMVGGRHIQVRLGNKTSDGGHHYAQITGYPQLFLIVSNWGDVLIRLATDPPYPKWYVKRDPDEIVELNIYAGDYTDENTPWLSFTREDDGWYVQDWTKDKEATPVDQERWEQIKPLLAGPPDISVAKYKASDDEDYEPFGITKDTSAIEIRFEGFTERGTRFIDGVLFKLGSKTPDGGGYYARSESSEAVRPVLVLPAQWVETILALYDDIPYGQPQQAKAQEGATSG